MFNTSHIILVASLEKPRLGRGPRWSWSRYVLGLKREASKLSVDGAIWMVTEEAQSADLRYDPAKPISRIMGSDWRQGVHWGEPLSQPLPAGLQLIKSWETETREAPSEGRGDVSVRL